jgi:hypothetical protein
LTGLPFLLSAPCAAAIFFRAAADMVRPLLPAFFGILPRVRKPSRLPSAARAWSNLDTSLGFIPLFAQLRDDIRQVRHDFLGLEL